MNRRNDSHLRFGGRLRFTPDLAPIDAEGREVPVDELTPDEKARVALVREVAALLRARRPAQR
jgi:hypothetical protein